MRIYSMTATFGKLEHQTLTLRPGLNIIHAPNEWGKSTWCAFLVAMFYGITTREHTTKAALADKDRYAPWSGSPMSGRIDLQWKGRDITIERRSKGRTVFGEFAAYETASGLPVMELNGANCGEMLLGVEKSVFTRSAFLRLTDLPVVQDEALRRRLNALVTTGDESGTVDALAQTLRDLKNRCRSNRANGLIPQVLAQKEELQQKLQAIDQLQEQATRLQSRAEELDRQLRALENHQASLRYAQSQGELRQLDAAKAAAVRAAAELEALRVQCAGLPDKETCMRQLAELEERQMELAQLQTEVLPEQPQQPQVPLCFAGMDPDAAMQQARSDENAFVMLSTPLSPVLPILTVLLLLGGIGLSFISLYIGIPVGLLALIPLCIHLRSSFLQARDRQAVADRYEGIPPEEWVEIALGYRQAMNEYSQRLNVCNDRLGALRSRTLELQNEMLAMTGGKSIPEFTQNRRQSMAMMDELAGKQAACQQAQSHAEALSAMVQQTLPPTEPDALRYSDSETLYLIDRARQERHDLHNRLGQCQGKIQSLGDRAQLARELSQLELRLSQLNETYEALELAQSTLTEATGVLQRRFAPQISRRAQELFSRLTDERYNRLTLTEDLSLQAGTRDEDTLHAAIWRSDGTVDQLYLALRLSVAEALIPQAPLVLDDALVRFDDVRLARAMEVLQDAARQRQVLLFTCQSREGDMLSQTNGL